MTSGKYKNVSTDVIHCVGEKVISEKEKLSMDIYWIDKGFFL